MELRGTEAWNCRMWYLITLGAVILATVFSMQYKSRMLEHYAKERLHTYLCCKQNVVTGHTNFIITDRRLLLLSEAKAGDECRKFYQKPLHTVKYRI